MTIRETHGILLLVVSPGGTRRKRTARTMTGLLIEESEEARMHFGASEWKIRVLADASRYQKIVSESQGEFDPGSG